MAVKLSAAHKIALHIALMDLSATQLSGMIADYLSTYPNDRNKLLGLISALADDASGK